MTDPEIIDWMTLLVDPLKTRTRFKLIKDLLDHANQDGMTFEDRGICVRALKLIEENPKLDYKHPTDPTPFDDIETELEH
jgi:hypothetical protein